MGHKDQQNGEYRMNNTLNSDTFKNSQCPSLKLSLNRHNINMDYTKCQ